MKKYIGLALILTAGVIYLLWPQDRGPSSNVLPQAGQPDTALFGYSPDEESTQAFLRTLPRPTLRERNPDLFRNEKKDVFLYRALDQAYRRVYDRPFLVGRQEIGDCVSWGWAHGIDVHLATRFQLGQSQTFLPAATESIYGGSRVEARGRTTGGWSDGSYGSAAAKWVREWGVIYRQEYPDHDLTTYSGRRAKDWGNYGNGGQNDNGKLDAEAKKHPVTHVALVTTYDEAVAAIQSGYPIPVCSMQGFSSTRDARGFAAPSGRWAHCMVFIGVRHDPDGLLCLNSWGPNWIRGPKWPEDQPEGSFWVDRATAHRMLQQRDSFAVSSSESFPFRDLDHTDWVSLPNREPWFMDRDHVFALAP